MLKSYPESRFAEQAEFLLAQCHDRAGAVEQAVQWYRQVLNRAKGRYLADALLALATIAYQQDQPAEAGTLLDRLLADCADSTLAPRAMLLRGRAWFDQGEYSRAAELFERAGQADEALAGEAAYWRAKCKLRVGEYVEAARQLEGALKAFPESELRPEMQYDRAVALVRGGDDELAARALEEFLAQCPQHAMAADAVQMLAAVEHRRGRFDASAEHCRAFLRDHADHPLAGTVAFLAAENDFLRGDYAKAVDAYRAFLSKYADHPRAKDGTYRLAMGLYRLERADDALPLLVKVADWVQSEPAFRDSLLALGDLRFQRSEWKQAEDRLDEYFGRRSGGCGGR